MITECWIIFFEWVSNDKTKSLSLLKLIFDMLQYQNDFYLDLLKKYKEIGHLKKENAKLQAMVESLKIYKARQENEISRIIYQNENSRKKLMKKIYISESEKKELYALREFLFTLGNDGIDVSDEESSCRNDDIDYHKIVIIGGHVKWANKIKKIIPDIEVISADQTKVDIKFIQNKRIVLFFVDYISHSLYLHIISMIKPSQKIGYIKHRNIDNVIKEIKKIYEDSIK